MITMMMMMMMDAAGCHELPTHLGGGTPLFPPPPPPPPADEITSEKTQTQDQLALVDVFVHAREAPPIEGGGLSNVRGHDILR